MSEPSLNLLIVDEDPVFRLGLVTALTTFPTLNVFGEVDRLDSLRQQLETTLPDILVIDPQFPRQSRSGWSLLRQLQNAYPTLAIALLTASLEYDQLLAAKSAGIAAYFPKGTAIAELVSGLQRIQQGQTCWPDLQSGKIATPSLTLWEKSLWRLFRDGLEQIERSLQQVQRDLQLPNLSDFDRLFWQGRQRELQTARWLVQRLMPSKLRLWQRANRLLTPDSSINPP
ncbi:MAG: hypothetical protein RLZZ490_454, partial [Cyanobacteriota bacterium]